MFLTEIEQAYGDITLSYSKQNPQEEQIRFSKAPSYLFFTHYGKKQIGIYNGKKRFNVSKRYIQNARLEFIGVRQI